MKQLFIQATSRISNECILSTISKTLGESQTSFQFLKIILCIQGAQTLPSFKYVYVYLFITATYCPTSSSIQYIKFKSKIIKSKYGKIKCSLYFIIQIFFLLIMMKKERSLPFKKNWVLFNYFEVDQSKQRQHHHSQKLINTSQETSNHHPNLTH